MQGPRTLARFAWLSIGAAITTMGLKAGAYLITGSVGLLSDALESVVNLAAAIFALAALAIAARPPDEDHDFGHGKVEYFSSGAEGVLIVLAALGIAGSAIDRLLHPRPLEALGLGLGISCVAAGLNFGVARVLLTAGRAHGSPTLEADGHHLMTDVWTSGGVLVGVGLVAITGFVWLDPLVALVVAVNVARTGVELSRRAVMGLLDAVLPDEERTKLQAVLDRYRSATLEFHAVWTRQAGSRRFVSMHVLVPGATSVAEAHALAESIERDVRAAIPRATVFTHLEPLEEPASYDDQALDR